MLFACNLFCSLYQDNIIFNSSIWLATLVCILLLGCFFGFSHVNSLGLQILDFDPCGLLSNLESWVSYVSLMLQYFLHSIKLLLILSLLFYHFLLSTYSASSMYTNLTTTICPKYWMSVFWVLKYRGETDLTWWHLLLSKAYPCPRWGLSDNVSTIIIDFLVAQPPQKYCVSLSLIILFW